MAHLTRGERFKDARVVYNQHGKQIMKDVSEKTGVSQSVISYLESDDNTRRVNSEDVAKLASHYGVSADFLLGLTEDYRRIPSAVDELGLSTKAVKHLLMIKQFADSETAPEEEFHGILSVLDHFVSSKEFISFLAFFLHAEKAAEKTRIANKPWEDRKRAKDHRLPDFAGVFADRYSYDYARYLCLDKFQKMLDAFCGMKD